MKNIFGAIQLAILFLPAHFLNEILLLKLNLTVVPLLIIPILMGTASFLAVYSQKISRSLFKFILSFPITIVFRKILIEMEFSLRALNWLSPGYGESSASGNFSGFIILCSLSFCVFAGNICGLVMSRSNLNTKKQNMFFLLQNTSVPVLCIGIIAAIAVLNNIMPPYNPVFG